MIRILILTVFLIITGNNLRNDYDRDRGRHRKAKFVQALLLLFLLFC
ncbi:MAG: hypothetical protein AAF206_16125 [Bacteroidota bacterium]